MTAAFDAVDSQWRYKFKDNVDIKTRFMTTVTFAIASLNDGCFGPVILRTVPTAMCSLFLVD